MTSTIRICLVSLGLACAGGVHASDATEFPVPTSSSLTRATVQAHTDRARMAGELRYDDASTRVAAPERSSLTRSSVRMESIEAMQNRPFGDRSVAGMFYIGGM